MIDVTDLKAKADAFEAAANIVVGYKAAPTVSTLAQMQAGTQAAIAAWSDLNNAVAGVQSQIDTDHPFDYT